VPILDKPIIEDPVKIDSLRVPDPGSNGRLPTYLEAIEKLYLTMGDVLPVFAYIPCPFTTAAGLRGIDEFLMDTIMLPQAAHQLLDISLRAAVAFCDDCIIAGALPILVDPLASGSVISRATFREFAQPYLQRLISYLHRYDLDITLHICGDTSKHTDLIAETGADLFSFDKLNVASAVQDMGEQVRLVGNLPPNGLLESSSLHIEDACNSVLSQGIANPKGFVLSTGCEVPHKCDSGKLHTMIDIGKNAKYEA